MEERKLTVERIVEIHNGIEGIGTIDTLDGTTSYWLGRFGDSCSSSVKNFGKQREKVSKELRPKQEALVKRLKDTIDENLKAELNKEIGDLNTEFTEKVQNILDQEETIKVPTFNMAQFVAKDEISKKETIREGETTKDVIIKIAKGQSLVPVRFFKAMGDCIKEPTA